MTAAASWSSPLAGHVRLIRAAAGPGPGRTQGRICARGEFAGHPACIFTPVRQEEAE